MTDGLVWGRVAGEELVSEQVSYDIDHVEHDDGAAVPIEVTFTIGGIAMTIDVGLEQAEAFLRGCPAGRVDRHREQGRLRPRRGDCRSGRFFVRLGLAPQPTTTHATVRVAYPDGEQRVSVFGASTTEIDVIAGLEPAPATTVGERPQCAAATADGDRCARRIDIEAGARTCWQHDVGDVPDDDW
jgi:hypothetical protein